jgi:hypothetical protein
VPPSSIALDCVPLEIDPGGDDKPIVVEHRSVFQRDGFLIRVDGRRTIVHHLHTQMREPAVAMRQHIPADQAADVRVGKKAAGIFRLRLDQRHVERGNAGLQRSHDRRAARAAPDHDNFCLTTGQCRSSQQTAHRESQTCSEFAARQIKAHSVIPLC